MAKFVLSLIKTLNSFVVCCKNIHDKNWLEAFHKIFYKNTNKTSYLYVDNNINYTCFFFIYIFVDFMLICFNYCFVFERTFKTSYHFPWDVLERFPKTFCIKIYLGSFFKKKGEITFRYVTNVWTIFRGNA